MNRLFPVKFNEIDQIYEFTTPAALQLDKLHGVEREEYKKFFGEDQEDTPQKKDFADSDEETYSTEKSEQLLQKAR